MRMRRAVPIAVVLALGPAARGDLWPEVHYKWTEQVETLWDGQVKTVTVDVYWVHFVADRAEHAASVWHPWDPVQEASCAGLTGPLNQAWGYGVMSTQEMMQIEDQLGLGYLSDFDVSVDTHLLLSSRKPDPTGPEPGEVWFCPGSLLEDRPSVLGQIHAVGSYFGTCDVGVFGHTQRLDLPFIQVAVPRGPQPVHMSGFVVRGAGQGEVYVDLWLGVPEPGAATLLGLAAASATCRRRRQRPRLGGPPARRQRGGRR